MIETLIDALVFVIVVPVVVVVLVLYVVAVFTRGMYRWWTK